MRLSAYLSIFDDWDFLPDALAAVAPYADEIVIVDGAYRWMAPMLRANGRDPNRSLPQVAACFAPYAHKLRVVSGLWEDEMEKRSAGYAACRGRYVLRFDADEIMFLTPALIEASIARGFPVASVEMPTYMLPGWISSYLREDGTPADIERQCVLFDRSRISTEQHLTYLWLVLGNAEKARLGQPDPANVDPVPLGYNAHLTCWRTPQTSVHRARFYVMNWMRDAGAVPWLGGIPVEPEDGFAAFFKTIPPDAFASLLLGHEITAGQPAFGRWAIRKAPLNAIYDPRIAGHFSRLLKSLAKLNVDLAARGRLILSGMPCCIDVSSAEALAALGPRSGELIFEFDQALASCTATLLVLAPAGDDDIGHGTSTSLSVTVEGSKLSITLPDFPRETANMPHRRTLMIEACADTSSLLRLVPGGKFVPTTHTSALDAGRAASATSDWARAAALWKKVFVENPASEEAHLRLGEALLQSRQFGEAELFCERAWRDYPDNLWIGRNWALVAMSQSHWEESVSRFRDVCSRHTHDALQADLGECLLALGRRDEALIVVSNGLDQFPQSEWLHRLSVRLPNN